MKVKIISVAKVKQAFILEGEAEYAQRFPQELKLECVEVGAESAAMSGAQIKAAESKKVLEKISRKDFVIALDERGKQLSSQQFAGFLQEQMNRGAQQVVFLIGGAYGFDETVRSRANMLLSLSAFTFTYQMSRLILIEQLYRAVSIIKGLPYHKS